MSSLETEAGGQEDDLGRRNMKCLRHTQAKAKNEKQTSLSDLGRVSSDALQTTST